MDDVAGMLDGDGHAAAWRHSRTIKVGVCGTIVCSSALLVNMVHTLKSTQEMKTGWGDFALHPVLMTLAFGFLSPIAASCYRGLERLGGLSHAKAKTVHAVLMSGSLLCGVLGVRDMWIVHGKVSPEFHLISVHSWLGLAALIAFSFQWLTGVTVFFTPLAERLTTRRAWLPIHIFIGCFATFGTLGSIATGILSLDYSHGQPPAYYKTPEQIQYKLSALLVMATALFLGLLYATPRQRY